MDIKKILEQHELWLNTNGEKGERANLKGANLEGADLYEANLFGANLERANLERANLEGANLKEASLCKANLYEANLEGANLNEANLTFIKGKDIYVFHSSKHTAFAFDGLIQIGCECHSIEHWIENYVQIGKAAQYSDKEIEKYGKWIKAMAELTKT